MLIIKDRIAGEQIWFHYVQSTLDIQKVREFLDVVMYDSNGWLAIDTESTGLNCYHPKWSLRTVQIGDRYDSYVIPARYKKTIDWLMKQDIKWIGHNGPHDIRSIDAHLGYETGVVCAGETYIPMHHFDSRNKAEGGVGHGLKEQAVHYIDREAGKWEIALKAEFKKILIPIPGEVYKSGPRRNTQKYRKAKLAEGWRLINPTNPVYIAYAAADPILTYRRWEQLQPVVREFRSLYRFDHAVQIACDRLQRRAIPLDIPYTKRLLRAYTRRADALQAEAEKYGCANIHSGQQVTRVLLRLGCKLTERTPTGQYKVDDKVMRGLLSTSDSPQVIKFVTCVLVAKQLIKRRETYCQEMLEQVDARGRIHPSINSLGARTARMSVSKPALQQLPTKDREGDEVVRDDD